MTPIFHKKPEPVGREELDDYRVRMTYLQNRLEKVRQLCDLECDPEKIDALIYEEKALMISLNHLIKTSRGIKSDIGWDEMF